VQIFIFWTNQNLLKLLVKTGLAQTTFYTHLNYDIPRKAAVPRKAADFLGERQTISLFEKYIKLFIDKY